VIKAVNDYKRKVDVHFKEIYGSTWDDLCGEEEPLADAIDEGEDPKEFVLRFGEKYDLDKLSDLGL